MAYKAISGASCKVYLSATGQEIGWATGVDVSENIQTQRVDIIGDLDSQEIVPTRRTATMTVNAIRIQRTPMESLGAWNIGDSQDVINAPALDFAIIDDNTGETLVLLEGCRPTTRAFRVDSQSLFSENLSFEIRRLKYPSE
tara:strand:- start:71 stop:496 length:426 start_codon:yes stop_codon:yes gene_type:complete